MLDGLLASVLTIGLLIAGSRPAKAVPNRGLDVKVLIISSMELEPKPWLDRREIAQRLQVPGVGRPVSCTAEGVCILITGIGKANAAVSVSAVLGDPQFDLSRTIFLTAGVAGTPPQVAALGSVAWARYILDFDLYHYSAVGSDGRPVLVERRERVGYELFTLNRALVDRAFAVTKGTSLLDDAKAKAYRAHYPNQAGRVPEVLACDTVSGDNYWHGEVLSKMVSRMMAQKTKGAGLYCTTEMEDSATAGAIRRFGYLDRYLNLRAIGNFDQPYPGQSVEASLVQHHFEFASENLYRVADAFVQYLLTHREEILALTRRPATRGSQ